MLFFKESQPNVYLMSLFMFQRVINQGQQDRVKNNNNQTMSIQCRTNPVRSMLKSQESLLHTPTPQKKHLRWNPTTRALKCSLKNQ
jgi:hypothetical protein